MEIRELFADYAHEAWSGWMRYMFGKSTKNSDGSITIPSASVERWERQMNTPYVDLPEHEKKSDLDEADKILVIFGEEYRKRYEEVRQPQCN